MRLVSNIKAVSRRSKQLSQNGHLNRLILWQGGVVNDDCFYYLQKYFSTLAEGSM